MNDRRAELITSLIVLGLSWWATLPVHQQRQILMTCARTLQKTALRLAESAGRWGMAAELDYGEEGLGYRVAYRIMTGPYRHAEHWYHTTAGAHP